MDHSNQDKPNEPANNIALAVVAALSVLLYAGLYFLRALDNNSLTSWNRVFGFVDVVPVFAFLLLAVFLAAYASRHIKRLSPGILFVIAFLLGAVFWQEPEVIVDTSRYFTQAKHLSEYGIGFFLTEWGRGIEPWTDMPLVPFLYGLGFSVFGESRTVIQVITTSAFAGTVWLTALSAREFFSEPAEEDIGLIAGGFLLAIPYLYSQVPLMLVDVPSMFFLILGFFSLERALVRGGWGHIAFASVAIFLMLISKYSLWMFASLYVVLFLYKLRQDPSQIIKRGLSVAAGVLVLSAVFVAYYHDVMRTQIDLLVSYQRPGLRLWGESFFSTFFFQTHPFVTISALGSLVIAFRRRDLRWVVVAWLIALVLLLRIERSRYLIPLLPMFTITAAYGLNALATSGMRRLVVAVAVSASVVLGAGAYLPYLRTNNLVNLMEAGRFLDANKADVVRVFAFPQKSVINPAVAVPILDLYTSAPIVYEFDLVPTLTRQQIKRSLFRFTWTYINPSYYQYGGQDGGEYGEDEMPGVVAVVSFWENSTNIRNLPPGYRDYRLLERFDISEGIFRFRPFVSIYERQGIP